MRIEFEFEMKIKSFLMNTIFMMVLMCTAKTIQLEQNRSNSTSVQVRGREANLQADNGKVIWGKEMKRTGSWYVDDAREGTAETWTTNVALSFSTVCTKVEIYGTKSSQNGRFYFFVDGQFFQVAYAYTDGTAQPYKYMLAAENLEYGLHNFQIVNDQYHCAINKAIYYSMKRIRYPFLNKSNGWSNEGNGNGGYTTTVGASISAVFSGSKLYVYGYKDPKFGKCFVTIDNQSPFEVNTYAPSRAINQLLYQREDLSPGEHKVKLEMKTGGLGINFIEVLPGNTNSPKWGFEKSAYEVYQGGFVDINIVRIGDISAPASFSVSTVDGTASSSTHYLKYSNNELRFEANEVVKSFRIITNRIIAIKNATLTFKISIKTLYYDDPSLISIGEATITIHQVAYTTEKSVRVSNDDARSIGHWVNETASSLQSDTDGAYANNGFYDDLDTLDQKNGTLTASKSITFYGNAVRVFGYLSEGHGFASITLDDKVVSTFNTNDIHREKRFIGATLYENDHLNYGEHRIKIGRITDTIGFNYFEYSTGVYRFAKAEYSAELGDDIIITVTRDFSEVPGSVKIARWLPETTAIYGVHFEEFYEININFGIGETTKTATIHSKGIELDKDISVLLKLYLKDATKGKLGDITKCDIHLKGTYYQGFTRVPYSALTKSSNSEWKVEQNVLKGVSKGGYLTYKFIGRYICIYGVREEKTNKLSILIDDQYLTIVDTKVNAQQIANDKHIYTVNNLEYGLHTITIINHGSIGINYLAYGRNHYVPYGDMTEKGSWIPVPPNNGGYTETGSKSYVFTGIKVIVYGTFDPNQGKMKITIDGVSRNVSLQSQTLKKQAFVFSSGIMENKQHKIIIAAMNKVISLNFIEFVTPNDKSSPTLGFEKSSYELDQGEYIDLKVIRKGDVSQEVTCTVKTQDGEAKVGTNFEPIESPTLTFKANEVTKFVRIFTKEVTFDASNAISFTCKLTIQGQVAKPGQIETTISIIQDQYQTANLKEVKVDQLGSAGKWEKTGDAILGQWTDTAGSSKSLTFKGSKAIIYGLLPGPDYKFAEVYIDDVLVEALCLMNDARRINNIIFESQTLPFTEHTIRFSRLTSNVGINSIKYLNLASSEGSQFSFEKKQYVVEKGDIVKVVIKRFKNLNKEASVSFDTIPETAQEGINYHSAAQRVTFAPNQEEAVINIQTILTNENTNRNYTFNVKLSNPSGGSIVSSDDTAKVTISNILNPEQGYVKSAFELVGGGTKTLRFRGTKVWIYSVNSKSTGKIRITLDGIEKEVTINGEKIIFTSGDLNANNHDLKIESLSQSSIQLEIRYLDNFGKGMIFVPTTSISIDKGKSLKYVIQRVGGTIGTLKVGIKTSNKGGIAGQHYVAIDQQLTFSDGETEKEFTISTLNFVSMPSKDRDFTIGILSLNDKTFISDNQINVVVVDIFTPSEGLKFLSIKDESVTANNWNEKSDGKLTNTAGAEAIFKITATKILMVGTVDPSHGQLSLSIDGQTIATVDEQADSRKERVLLYTSGDLEKKEHTITVKQISKTIEIYGIYYAEEEASGKFQFKNTQITVDKTKVAKVTIELVGVTNGPSSVRIQTNGESAQEGIHFVGIDEVIEFEEGTKEKVVDIYTYDYRYDILSNLAFSVELSEPTSASLGTNTVAHITIIDHFSPMAGFGTILSKDSIMTGSWDEANDGFSTTTAKSKMSFVFYGSAVWLLGTRDSSNRVLDISIDGTSSTHVSSSSSERKTNDILFASNDLEYKSHILTITNPQEGNIIEIYGIKYLDNEKVGLIEIPRSKYLVNQNSKVSIRLVRVGGHEGTASVQFTTNGDTAIENTNFDPVKTKVTFENGITEQIIPINIKSVPNGTVRFTAEISDRSPLSLCLGFNQSVIIDISHDYVDNPTPEGEDSTSASKRGKFQFTIPIIAGIAAAAFVIIIIIIVIIVLATRKSRKSNYDNDFEDDDEEMETDTLSNHPNRDVSVTHDHDFKSELNPAYINIDGTMDDSYLDFEEHES